MNCVVNAYVILDNTCILVKNDYLCINV